ncbi:MAG: DNA alkylation repair protein [Candidatus Limnocylindrales bacterium]
MTVLREPPFPLPSRNRKPSTDLTGVKGARSRAQVHPGFLEALEAGCVESRTHVEQMAITMSRLLAQTFPKLTVGLAIDDLPFITRLRVIGRLLHEQMGHELVRSDSCWVSDTVRGWIAMGIAEDEGTNLVGLLTRLSPFARDHHFAVREWAWLAARPAVVARPIETIALLGPFLASADPYDRRFAVELTRPRSVWGSHIAELKAYPEAAEAALGRLRCEPHPYVRKSIANWLSDAARSRPDWSRRIAQSWLNECECADTRLIVRASLRGAS